MLPLYLSLGVSEERIFDGTPNDLKPFLEAQKLKHKMHDEEAWTDNQYTMVAVSVALQKFFFGKKSKAKYLEKPLYQIAEEKRKDEEENKQLTEDDKKKGRENLLMMLQLMQINFNNSHKK